MAKLKIQVFGISSFLLFTAFRLDAQLNTEIWNQFVDNQSPINYLICVNQITTQFPIQNFVNDNGEILIPFWNSFLDKEIFAKLLQLMDNGNVLATDLWFRLYPYLGSGEPSELINQRFGNVLKRDPNLFFTLYTMYFPNDVSKKETKRILDFFILNIDLRDQQAWRTYQGKIKEYENRIETLRSVTEPKYSSIRDLCIEILDNQKQEIINLLKENLDAKP